jgi:hypothetical protein
LVRSFAGYNANATMQILASDSTSVVTPITCTQSIPAMAERCACRTSPD